MFRFVVWCVLGYNESVYLKVFRDVLCEFRILIISGLYDPLRYNVDALNIKLKVISVSRFYFGAEGALVESGRSWF